MKLPILAIITSTIITTGGVPINDPSAMTFCHTTPDSPRSYDAALVCLDLIGRQKELCYTPRAGAADCIPVGHFARADATICGASYYNRTVQCEDLGVLVWSIIEKCTDAAGNVAGVSGWGEYNLTISRHLIK